MPVAPSEALVSDVVPGELRGPGVVDPVGRAGPGRTVAAASSAMLSEATDLSTALAIVVAALRRRRPRDAPRRPVPTPRDLANVAAEARASVTSGVAP